ncbi:M20/M25/M40 family metallo-hydrolase [Aquabacter sp. L1I39]|uniref:M20 family metallopeptidase n=1 Tax=Aquabacter sp. L1I39 TaxID=2820278 RepID=UPI001ADAB4BA|nr:M20/M25/M40 family metallo-hydrolase [Aquabacter sp. L1I39]QTL04708.1 M20/M25/M40 family metallo-hydrolase [Aquabacter sp. L1I39]
MTVSLSPKLSASPSSLREQVLVHITEDAWLDLACELIPAGQPEAENPLDPDLPGGREEGIALLLADKLSALGFAVEMKTRTAHRPNVIGVLPGTGDGPSLILNDHLDTYPAGDWSAWTMTGGHPFRPTRHGDLLYARGTSDTRGNLACTLLAVEALRVAGVTLKGTLKCVYTVDEEKNGPDGSIFLLDECGLEADHTIVCEPTAWTAADGSWGMGIAIANCGNFLVEVETRGIKTHLWRPDTGLNAVTKMLELLPQLERMAFRHTPPPHEGGTPPMVTVLRIQGGEPREMQFTPDRCKAVLGVVGILPGMTQESVMADIAAVIDAACADDGTLQAVARPFPGALFVDGTGEQEAGSPLVRALSDAYGAVLTGTPKLYRKNAFNDTIRFSERGFKAVTFGPGEDGWAPVNESIHIGKAVAATRILALAVMELLGVEE